MGPYLYQAIDLTIRYQRMLFKEGETFYPNFLLDLDLHYFSPKRDL